VTRLRHFIENTGIWGGIKLLLIVVVVILIISQDAAASTRLYTVPALIVSVLLTYAIRDLLVRNAHTVVRILNILIFVGLAGSFLAARSRFADTWWMSTLVVAFVGAYMGTEFWLLSDPRIVVGRP
jgi:hypothetical protein